MKMRPNSIEARDIAYHVHGYTNARAHEANGPLVIDRGEGVYVFDTNGNRYIEGMAGLWSVAVGFNESRLVEAAQKQMSKLPFYHNFSQKYTLYLYLTLVKRLLVDHLFHKRLYLCIACFYQLCILDYC